MNLFIISAILLSVVCVARTESVGDLIKDGVDDVKQTAGMYLCL